MTLEGKTTQGTKHTKGSCLAFESSLFWLFAEFFNDPLLRLHGCLPLYLILISIVLIVRLDKVLVY